MSRETRGIIEPALTGLDDSPAEHARHDHGSPSVVDWPTRLAVWTGRTAVVATTAATSLTHIRDTAEAHGQHGWRAWAIAASIEIVVGLAWFEIRRDRALGRPSILPWTVLIACAVLSLAANLATAPPEVWGYVMAGWPSLGFLATAKLVARSAPARPRAEPEPEPDRHPLDEVSPITAVSARDMIRFRLLMGEPAGPQEIATRFHLEVSAAEILIQEVETELGGTGPSSGLRLVHESAHDSPERATVGIPTDPEPVG